MSDYNTTLGSLPAKAFFELPKDDRLWRIVYPYGGAPANKLPDGQVYYGIEYQPTPDGNSVFAYQEETGNLFRLLANTLCRRVYPVLVIRPRAVTDGLVVRNLLEILTDGS